MSPRRLPALAALAAALALPAAARAALPETLLLDAHDATPNEQPTVVAQTPLLAGHPYTITVQGTYSIVPADRWLVPAVCGKPEAAPLLPSPGVTNGRVGADAEVQFARTTEQGCSGPYPRPHNRFQVDLGNGFRHIHAAGEPFTSPAPADTYTYAVTGTGAAPRFRIFDQPASDNYGMLRIVVVDADPAGPPSSTPTNVPPPPARHGTTKRVCVARRDFTLRLRRPRSVRRITVSVDGRRVRVRYGRRRATVRIDLRHTRKTRVRVRIGVLLRGGGHRTDTRTYATCARWAVRAVKDEIRTNPAKREPTPAS